MNDINSKYILKLTFRYPIFINLFYNYLISYLIKKSNNKLFLINKYKISVNLFPITNK